MNLYFRLLWALLRAWRKPPITQACAIERTLRVLPNDLDINGHMNNGRYMTLVDLMLIEYFVRLGAVTEMLRRGWRPMSGGAFITYRRGLGPLACYRIRFRLDGGSEVWNFMRFEFVDERGRLCAAGYFKGALVGRNGFVEREATWAALGLPSPQGVPEAVQHWLGAERALLAAG